MRWGAHLKDLELAAAVGYKSKALQTRPQSTPRLELVLACLRDLAGDRNAMNGRIPFVAVRTWCEAAGVDTWWVWERLKAAELEREAYSVSSRRTDPTQEGSSAHGTSR